MDNKPTTIKEIARRLKISPSSVSRALSDHHSIGLRTKLRVREMAMKMNYEPNMTAVYLKKKKTFTIGVILPNLSEQFFSTAINGIEDYTTGMKYNVVLGQSHDRKEKEMLIVDAMKNQRVDGLLVSVSKNTDSYEHFEMLKRHNIPIVFFDRIPELANINYVDCNIETGMHQAIGYLAKKGHKHIALLNGPDMLKATKERHDSFVKALDKNNLILRKEYMLSTDLSPKGTQLAMKELISMKPKPTAIIAFNDYVALDAIQFAKKEKIKINKDISFVSFANLPICNYVDTPPLASVEQFPYLQGQRAAAMLFDLIEAKTNGGTESEKGTFYSIETELAMH